MKIKIFQAFILIALCLGGFYALYYREYKAPLPPPATQEEKEQVLPAVPEEKVEKAVVQPQEIPSTITVNVDEKVSFSIGIFGESAGDESLPFNRQIISQFFKSLKEVQVKAIFLTGNIVSGTGNASLDNTQKPKVLEDQLGEFLAINQEWNGAALFPTLGDREISIPGAAAVLINQFNLRGAKAFGRGLGYTVSIGPAFFVVLATEDILQSPDKQSSLKWLDWLGSVLKKAKADHRFLFVIGNDPVFPSSSTYVEKNIAKRNQFWKILVENGVLAYFASSEHLFDRSLRNGVWQVISGGGGGTSNEAGETHPFFHYLMLTIPSEEKSAPKIQVLDPDGKILMEFDLSKNQEPLYQMRVT